MRFSKRISSKIQLEIEFPQFEDQKVVSPMKKRFYELKKRHPDALLLFRCGDFYETYEQDAVDVSEILGITLTRTSGIGTPLERSMAGFPYTGLNTNLPKLIRAGRRIGIYDQIEDNRKKK